MEKNYLVNPLLLSLVRMRMMFQSKNLRIFIKPLKLILRMKNLVPVSKNCTGADRQYLSAK